MFYVEHVRQDTGEVLDRREWNGHVSDEDDFRDYARIALEHASHPGLIIRLLDELGRELYSIGADGDLTPDPAKVGR